MTKVPFSLRVESDVLSRLADQAHVRGFGNARQYAQESLKVLSLLNEAEIPSTLRAEPGPEEDPVNPPLMSPLVSRENPCGRGPEHLVHKLLHGMDLEND